MPLRMRALTVALCLPVFVLGLTSCGRSDPPVPDAATIAALRPSDARLAEIYATSCQACHTNPDSGAPQTGVAAQWKDRLAKGMPVLLKNVLEGVNGMPAGGQCFACQPAEYEALIRFMSQPPAKAP